MAAVRELDQRDGADHLGFSASIQDATLADLVQMKCLSGSHGAVRVSSGDDVGYLFFRGGNVVHAMSPSNMGEAAALEIFGWTSGTFEACNAGFPENESIQVATPVLLLRSAQARDESGRRSLAQFRRPASPPGPAPRPPAAPERSAVTEDGQRSQSPESRRSPASGPAPVARVRAAVRLDAHGNLLSSKGSGAEELAAVAALAARIGSLIGDSLGLGPLLAVEGGSPSQKTLIVLEKTGNIVGLRAATDADLMPVRERYGL